MTFDELLIVTSFALQDALRRLPSPWLLLALAAALAAAVWYTQPARRARRHELRLHYLHQILLIVETPAPPVDIIARWSRRQLREVEHYCYGVLYDLDDMPPAEMPAYPACLRDWRGLASLHDAAEDPAPTGTLADLTVIAGRLHPQTPWPVNRRRCECCNAAGEQCRLFDHHAGHHRTIHHEVF